MDSQDVRRKIEEARRIVGGDPEDPLTQIAFGEILRRLLSESAQAAEGDGIGNGTQRVRGLRISEFLAQRKISTETDRVVAILYYQLHNGHESSTRAEILEAYSAARTRKPTNLSDVIARCIRKGHVVDAPEKKEGQKAWQITHDGERYVRDKLTA